MIGFAPLSLTVTTTLLPTTPARLLNRKRDPQAALFL